MVNDLANCKNNSFEGNIITWSNGWRLNNINKHYEDSKVLCARTNSNASYRGFPSKTETEALYICEALGGKLPEVSSLSDVHKYFGLYQELWSNSKSCRHFWTDLTDRDREDTWIRSTKPFGKGKTFWADNEPDGYIYQECALIFSDGLHDIPCSLKSCVFCEITSRVVFSLRGTCESEKRHIYFKSVQSSFGALAFIGYGQRFMSSSDNKWMLTDSLTEEVLASMEVTTHDDPLGQNIWNLSKSMCNQESGLRPLLLTPCSYEQFTCSDVKCIPLLHRCDMKYDCLDHSDEDDCFNVRLPPEYQKLMPPRPSMLGVTTLPVELNIVLTTIVVDTMSMKMLVSYELSMSWFDSRINFLNIKNQTLLNIVQFAEMKNIWTPTIDFINTEDSHSTIVDEKATLFISKLTNEAQWDTAAPSESMYTNLYHITAYIEIVQI